MELSVSPALPFDPSDVGASTDALIQYCQTLSLRAIPVPLPRLEREDGFNFAVTAEIVRRLETAGIRPAIAHGPGDPPIARERLEEDGASRQRVNERAAEDIARLGEAGVPTLVMFCRLPRGNDAIARQKSWEIIRGAFEAMTTAAEKAGVYLAPHGLHNTGLHNYEEQRALVDAIPSAHLGICYDAIHTSLNGHTIREHGDYLTPIRLLKGRIVYVHIRDMVMSKDLDKPIEVPIGEGMIDQLAVLQKLKEIGYTGVVQVEHMPNDLANARSLGYLRGLIRAGLGG